MTSQPTQPLTEPTGQEILATSMGENDADAATIRDYLIKLLEVLWEEQEGFGGKRPFGNSSWEYELHGALLDAGYITGQRDEDGYIDDVDEASGNRLIFKAIRALGLDQDGRQA